jgi:hypothetical protein
MTDCAGGEVELSGRVLDVTGAPLACCDLEIEIDTYNPTGPIIIHTRTDTEGNYSICFACEPGVNEVFVTVRALCCGTEVEAQFLDCPESYVMPDLVCANTPVTDQIVVRGRVECRNILGLPEGVAGCTVQVHGYCDGGWGEVVTAVTDGNGYYEVCFPCPVNCQGELYLRAIPQCCQGIVTYTSEDPCPAEIEMPIVVCPGDCPDLPCPGGETLIKGNVKCEDPWGGLNGLPGCNIEITIQGGASECYDYLETYQVETDIDGDYELCVPCPPDCDVWTVDVHAGCCGETLIQTVEGCPPTVAFGDINCGPCPTGPPCDAGETLIGGMVACPDGTPVADCTVRIESANCLPPPGIHATTDENGLYSVCVPCANCPDPTWITIHADCCGAFVRTEISCTDPINEVPPLICDPCPPERPCGPEAIEVTGRVMCHRDPLHPSEPIAGCEVELVPQGCNVPSVTVETDGDGYYRACFECDDNCPHFELLATASCCNASQLVTVQGCPATITIPDINCSDCSPCPPHYTRVQGKVFCFSRHHIGPMADCPVEITVDTCDGPFTTVTTTDAHGRYHACVPCPCEGDPDAMITAESLCCDGKRSRKTHGRCRGHTGMPTIICHGNCH